MMLLSFWFAYDSVCVCVQVIYDWLFGETLHYSISPVAISIQKCNYISVVVIIHMHLKEA